MSGYGVISGTPVGAVTTGGTVTASNGTPPNATQHYSIVIEASTVTTTPPVLPEITPPPGMVGLAYNIVYTAVSGSLPISYTATNLPPGLSISSSTGVISGTPTTPDTYVCTVIASNGTLPNATRSFSIVVETGVPTV